jgi:hypothetical protein
VLLREVEDYPGEVDCLVEALSQVGEVDCLGEVEDFPVEALSQGAVEAEWDLASVYHLIQLVMCCLMRIIAWS